jgi:hypothetical protein
MRKLVVVMLTVGSLLLLEAPALAPHLYGLSSRGTETSGGQLRISGWTTCPGTVRIVFVSGLTRTPTLGSANSSGRRSFSLTLPDNATNERPAVQVATCNGVKMTLTRSLAGTGVPAVHKLAFAAMLLATGVVLLILGRRQAGAGPG